VTLVVDASALVAIALFEPERDSFLRRLEEADAIFIAPVNVLEAGLAIVLRERLLGLNQFAAWLTQLRVSEVDVSGDAALEAYLRYGKGVHRAGLNLGDCFAYALAKQLDAPLLFKGDDFGVTDVRVAIQPT
jgi:ribonuclease VapC